VILADTSAWVEYDRATASPPDLRIRDLIVAGDQLAVTEPVVMEVCAGARDDRRERDLRRLLQRCTLLPLDPLSDFDGAVRIYRRCRAAGVTPRGLIDCMVAAVAWRTGAAILAHDVDLDRVAGVLGIPVDTASLRAASG
jgi:predicted nucleic acid-binding protein